jgi:pimeloyl-ACP methyl ester carboxylesterase
LIHLRGVSQDWAAPNDSPSRRRPTIKSVDFSVASGELAPAELWEITVFENRSDSNSRSIPLRFLRFETRSARPAHPIIYLAGGPGGAGTEAAKGKRWELFDRLRDVADVIILDQRGTGISNALPGGSQPILFPHDQPGSPELYTNLYRQALRECVAVWARDGIDYRGYTTWESAADVDSVRDALGVEKVNLLGISYGTHLALATLKRYPDRVDRLVLASVEGLDQTVKLPARTDDSRRRSTRNRPRWSDIPTFAT